METQFIYMETINKIRAEIAKRIGKYDNILCDWDEPEVQGRRKEAVAILTFLDTLEEPDSEDLEKEIDAYYKEWDGNCRYAQTARHFAKWGAEHLKK